uniref:Ig-like domain-containing protein n=1 Tax=Lynx canadensis TaxID=61383 RepID=A0A667H343_LYNCA
MLVLSHNNAGTALLSLTFSFCTGISQKVTQAPPAMLVQEKEAVILECTYDTSDPNYSLLWYKQPSRGEMIFLVRQDSYNQQNATEGRYSLNFQKARKSIHLVISASQLEDSAVYFCALRMQASDSAVYYCAASDTVTGTAGGAEHKL